MTELTDKIFYLFQQFFRIGREIELAIAKAAPIAIFSVPALAEFI